MPNSPDSDKSYYDRGADHYFAKRYPEAIEDLTKSIEIDPDNYRVYDLRGSAYKSLKQFDRALSDYNRALEINPQFDNAYRNRAHVFGILIFFILQLLISRLQKDTPPMTVIKSGLMCLFKVCRINWMGHNLKNDKLTRSKT